MSSIQINGDTSGSVIIAAPAVAGSTTLTLPTTSGTVLTSANAFSAGTGPAFSAYSNANQNISTSSYTKLQFQIEEFDTNSNYDNATNYRFTPTVAGYYQIYGSAIFNIAPTTLNGVLLIYKNGSAFKSVVGFGSNLSGWFNPTISSLVYLNGTTDYIEMYIWQSSGSTQTVQSATSLPYLGTYFQGFLARSA